MSKNSLQHLAIIPDGNRRWAKQHALKNPLTMYSRGTSQSFEVLEAAFSTGATYVTFWASSHSNLAKRGGGFFDAMQKIYLTNFQKLATYPLVTKYEVKISVIGEWRELLEPHVGAILEDAMKSTAHYNKRHLTMLVGYDGRRERGAAVQALVAEGHTPPSDPAQANDMLRRYSWTANLPELDLLVRTGSWQDPHNSAAFLSLLNTDSQYVFPPVLWPDFTGEMLHNIHLDFENRQRRKGT